MPKHNDNGAKKRQQVQESPVHKHQNKRPVNPTHDVKKTSKNDVDDQQMVSLGKPGVAAKQPVQPKQTGKQQQPQQAPAQPTKQTKQQQQQAPTKQVTPPPQPTKATKQQSQKQQAVPVKQAPAPVAKPTAPTKSAPQQPQKQQLTKKQQLIQQTMVESSSESEEEEEESELDHDEDEDEDMFPDDEDDEDFMPGEGEDDGFNPFAAMFAKMFGGEGEDLDQEEVFRTMMQLLAARAAGGEGDEGDEGDFFDGEGEGFGDFEGEDFGEGEFDFGSGGIRFGEGEEFFDGEGEGYINYDDYSDEDEDDDEDDEDNRSENDDLDELLSLQAPAKKTPLIKKQQAEKAKKEQQKQKAKKQQKDADSDEDDGDSDDDDDIQAEFNFHDPDNEKDWHAVKRFVANLIDKKDFNASEFADIITQQPQVGTMIKCPDAGEEPLGFITALSFKEHEGKQSMKQIKDYIINNAGNEKNKKQIQQLFATQNVGLLLTDRLVNLPMEVVPPLYNELIKDVDYAKKALKQAKTKQAADTWDFKYYILISQSSDSGSGASKPNKKGNNNADDNKIGEIWYTRFEDEFFSKHAQMIKKVPTSQNKAWLDTGKLPISNVVMVLPAAALTQVRDHLAKVIGMGGEEHFM